MAVAVFAELPHGRPAGVLTGVGVAGSAPILRHVSSCVVGKAGIRDVVVAVHAYSQHAELARGLSLGSGIDVCKIAQSIVGRGPIRAKDLAPAIGA